MEYIIQATWLYISDVLSNVSQLRQRKRKSKEKTSCLHIRDRPDLKYFSCHLNDSVFDVYLLQGYIPCGSRDVVFDIVTMLGAGQQREYL